MSKPDFEVVNVVGTGRLGRELDVNSLHEDIPHFSYKTGENQPGVYVHLTEHDDYTDFASEGYTTDELSELSPEDYEQDEDKDVEEYPPDINLPLTTFFRSGKYIIRGVRSLEQLAGEHDRVLDELSKMDGISEDFFEETEENFTLSNIVAVGKMDEEINLRALAIALGLGDVEYEPERFPALIYRSDDYPCIFLVFGSGKIVIPGILDVDAAEKALYEFADEIREWVL